MYHQRTRSWFMVAFCLIVMTQTVQGARHNCMKGWFICNNGVRIRCTSTCDQAFDCTDLSDEEDCLRHVGISTSSTTSLTVREPRIIHNEDDQVDSSSDFAVIGVIIAGLVLILTIIGVATFIYHKTRLVRQNYDNNDNLATPLDQGRYETRRPSELCHTGPAVSHYDTPLSNKPVPGARGDTHYDRLPKPVPYTAPQGMEGNYDCPKLPVPVPGARADTHYDTVRRPVTPVAFTDQSQEENYDCPRSPISVYNTQRKCSTPRLNVSRNNDSEMYAFPKSHNTAYQETIYDHPRRPSHEDYNSTHNSQEEVVHHEPTYDHPRRLSNEEHNPISVRNGYELYDSPRSPVDMVYVPVIHEEEDPQVYDIPATLPRPIASPRSKHHNTDPRCTDKSDNEDPIYANQNYVYDR